MQGIQDINRQHGMQLRLRRSRWSNYVMTTNTSQTHAIYIYDIRIQQVKLLIFRVLTEHELNMIIVNLRHNILTTHTPIEAITAVKENQIMFRRWKHYLLHCSVSMNGCASHKYRKVHIFYLTKETEYYYSLYLPARYFS